MKTQFDKVVIVTRKTRLQELRERFSTREQAHFRFQAAAVARVAAAPGVAGKRALEKAEHEVEAQFADFEEEASRYAVALQQVRSGLPAGFKLQEIDRGLVSSYLFGPGDVVVALGQDGLVANVAKYVGDRPLIGVNPEPTRFDGVLLPWLVQRAGEAMELAASGKARVREVTLAEAVFESKQRLLAFNDFFVGARTHVSARYGIRFGGTEENHSSSGVLVSTGAGSTGWLSSTFNMTSGIAAMQSKEKTPEIAPFQLAWEDDRLAFVVREPFVSRKSSARIVAGLVERGGALEIESHMASGGVVFSDGIEQDFIAFNAGDRVRIRASEQKARLVVP